MVARCPLNHNYSGSRPGLAYYFIHHTRCLLAYIMLSIVVAIFWPLFKLIMDRSTDQHFVSSCEIKMCEHLQSDDCAMGRIIYVQSE